ncbi:uncharacterized protein LOC103317965 [Nasonia vitripennis]|uniref:Uncharacterized protein n=1 Tax=Nasonia vitripennis TaxID=7425 RepID=A0A7M7T676_NASVI|nr:uncharacterized protein LOC103317965 [Nasonia vitripennis]
MTAEQEQSGRKSNRGHQLAYVVASSRSHDPLDKEPSTSGATPKRDGKKDSAGAAHHQRVLRSSNRSGNARKNCSKHFDNSSPQHTLYSPSPEPESRDSTTSTDTIPHQPRKRKTKQCKKVQQYVPPSRGPPTIYDYEQYLELQEYLAQRRKNIVPVSYAAPKLYESYSMNLRSYKLAGNASVQANVSPPPSLMGSMKDLYVEQEEDRRDLRMRHVVEMEKLALQRGLQYRTKAARNRWTLGKRKCK